MNNFKYLKLFMVNKYNKEIENRTRLQLDIQTVKKVALLQLCISFTKDECDKILGITGMTTEIINALCKELIMPVSFFSYIKDEDADEKSETMTLSVYETFNSKRIKKDYTLCCNEPT